MSARDTLLFSLLCVSFLTLHPTTAVPKPLPVPGIDLSNAASNIRNTTSNLLHKAKNFLGLVPENTTPQPTTKASIRIVLIPKVWPKRKLNATAKESTTTDIPTTSTELSWGSKILKGFGNALKKVKNTFSSSQPTTIPKLPSNVLFVPVNPEALRTPAPLVGEEPKREPCSSKKDESSFHMINCDPRGASTVAGFSWWMVMLLLGGMAAAAGAAWVLVARRRWSGVPPRFPWERRLSDCVKVKPTTLSYPCAVPPPPPPAYPAYPVPPVPEAGAQRVNSLYQPSVLASLHIYATPSVRSGHSGATWSANASEHVHIYETPPCFPA